MYRLEGHKNCSHKVESQLMSRQKRHPTQALLATHHQSPPGQNTGFIAKCHRLAFLFGLKSALHKTPAFHKQRKRKRGYKILVSLATKQKPYWLEFWFTYKNGSFRRDFCNGKKLRRANLESGSSHIGLVSATHRRRVDRYSDHCGSK